MKLLAYFLVCVASVMVGESADVNSKIYKGEDVDEFEFKWIVRLLTHNTNNCGGTLLSKKWVLTAAWCAKITYAVVLADYDRFVTDGEVQIPIKRVIIHPNEAFPANNIALIELVESANLTERRIGVVPRLATRRLQRKVRKLEKTCYATGWGPKLNEDRYWVYPNKLQKLKVKYVTDEECEATGFSLFPGDICQKSVAKFGGSCDDDGSPTMCYVNKKWTLVGVFSYFTRLDGCLVGVKADVDVAKYLKWIRKYVKNV